MYVRMLVDVSLRFLVFWSSSEWSSTASRVILRANIFSSSRRWHFYSFLTPDPSILFATSTSSLHFSIYICVNARLRTRICIYVCMYVYMYVCVYTAITITRDLDDGRLGAINDFTCVDFIARIGWKVPKRRNILIAKRTWIRREERRDFKDEFLLVFV